MKKTGVLLSMFMLALAGCGGGGGGGSTPTGSDSMKTLASISVSPKSYTVPKGATTQFVAMGIYSDSSTQDITASVTWASSKPEIATISNDAASKGKATSVADGTTTITAASGGIQSEPTDLKVFTLNPATDVFLGGEHHIGDGKWGNEPANSQIPVEDNVQQTYTAKFNLADQPTKFPSATISLETRGIEALKGYKDAIVINSHPYYFTDSNPDGSYTPFSVKVPANNFLPNQENTIVFQSSTSPNPGETGYDDFQFQNVLIQFGN